MRLKVHEVNFMMKVQNLASFKILIKISALDFVKNEKKKIEIDYSNKINQKFKFREFKNFNFRKMILVEANLQKRRVFLKKLMIFDFCLIIIK